MDIQKWTVGDITVTAVFEKLVEPEVLEDVVPDLKQAALAEIGWLKPRYLTEDGRAFGYVQAFVVEAAGKTILVDTCVGNDKNLDVLLPLWSRLQNDFMGTLKKMGFAPENFDVVVCTHLHPDHIGWNTTKVGDRWVPTFPKARYLFGRKEYEAAVALFAPADAPEPVPLFTESLKPVVDAGLVDFVETDHVLCDGVRLAPSPGHTVGHVCVMLESLGYAAMITGDWLHHPAQVARPHWGCQYDADQAQSHSTRKQMLELLVDKPTLMIGTHFPTPSGGRVVRDGDTYRFES
ncbi:MAG: MBL fold metallo-hydrolase [Xanthobacteraceae bacterium]|nr:MBL fold metallo-hydrolase [Xanthobacteraceae bacterium]